MGLEGLRPNGLPQAPSPGKEGVGRMRILIACLAAAAVGGGALFLFASKERETAPQTPLPNVQPAQVPGRAFAKTELASMLRRAHYLRQEGKVDEAIPLLLQVRAQDPHFEADFPEEKLRLDATAQLADCYEAKGR